MMGSLASMGLDIERIAGQAVAGGLAEATSSSAVITLPLLCEVLWIANALNDLKTLSHLSHVFHDIPALLFIYIGPTSGHMRGIGDFVPALKFKFYPT